MLLSLLFRRSQSAVRLFFFFESATTEVYTLSLHDALPISTGGMILWYCRGVGHHLPPILTRSEEHTSELQSRFDLVCRLLLEKKNYSMLPPSHQRDFARCQRTIEQHALS